MFDPSVRRGLGLSLGPGAIDSGTGIVGCQRSAHRVTVFVGRSGFTGPSGLQAMVAPTNSALRSVSG